MTDSTTTCSNNNTTPSNNRLNNNKIDLQAKHDDGETPFEKISGKFQSQREVTSFMNDYSFNENKRTRIMKYTSKINGKVQTAKGGGQVTYCCSDERCSFMVKWRKSWRKADSKFVVTKFVPHDLRCESVAKFKSKSSRNKQLSQISNVPSGIGVSSQPSFNTTSKNDVCINLKNDERMDPNTAAATAQIHQKNIFGELDDMSTCSSRLLTHEKSYEDDDNDKYFSVKAVNKKRKIDTVASMTDDDDDDDYCLMRNTLLDWTNKQGRILTAEGKYIDFYAPDTFDQTELPHYHLMNGTTHDAFETFRQSMKISMFEQPISKSHCNDVCGAWKRPLFMGLWEHSSDHDETVFNIQTNTLFVDIRIPRLRDKLLNKCSLKSNHGENLNTYSLYSNEDIQILSRQHAFAGFTIQGVSSGRKYCTRHHCIDWNFLPNISQPRPRPNKWWVEKCSNQKLWKEWAFATDPNQQHYYVERWERLDGDEFDEPNQFVLALRRVKDCASDGIVVFVGNHCNYINGRTTLFKHDDGKGQSTIQLVDAALLQEKRELALNYLEIEAGHALLTKKGWVIDTCTLPQKEGSRLGHFSVFITTADTLACSVTWKGIEYEVIECSCAIHELSHILNSTSSYQI